MSFKNRRCSEAIVIRSAEDFDKHDDYQWIAKSVLDDKYHVGYIFVDKPWYSQENQWTYYIKYQVNTSNYGCQRWEECVVEPDSIVPYTIRNRTKLNDLRDMDTRFVTGYLHDDYELGTDIDEVIQKLTKETLCDQAIRGFKYL